MHDEVLAGPTLTCFADKTMPGRGRPRGGRGKKVAPGGAAAAAPGQPHWAIVTYICDKVGAQKRGYYLDSVIRGEESEAKVEVEAAQRSDGGAASGYKVVFYAQVTAGARRLMAPLRAGEKKPQYDVWLYTRNYEGFREYEVKLVRTFRDKPQPDMPELPDEEWEAICIARNWMRFSL